MPQGTCSVEGCERAHYGKGLCAMHYQRWRKTGTTEAKSDVCRQGHDLTPDNVIADTKGKRRCKTCRTAYKATFVSAINCSVADCNEPQLAKGLCGKHYQRVKSKGHTGDPARYTPEERVRAARAATRRWQERNRETVLRKLRDQYWKNPDARRAATRAWREQNPERVREKNRQWREANPERRAELWRKWVQANPERAREIWFNKGHRRRAQMRQTASGRVSRKRIIEKYGMVCHLCGGEILSRSDLHMDHVIPLARGGAHIEENIRPAHAECNVRKGAKLLSELRE